VSTRAYRNRAAVAGGAAVALLLSILAAAGYGVVSRPAAAQTRPTTVQVTKACAGAVSGSFTLAVGATTAAVSCGGSTGPVPVTPGVVVTVGEATVPSGFVAAITCTGGVTTSNPSGGTVSITPPSGTETTCIVTNTATGSLTLSKVCNPSGDSGQFTFTVTPTGGSPVATEMNVGCGQSRTVTNLAPGGYTVTETAGAGTNLANYSSSVNCIMPAPRGAVGPAVSSDVIVSAGGAASCMITNTRLATVTVTKACVGNVPVGITFGLAVGTTTQTVACQGALGPVNVPPGVAVTVGEATPPAGYTATIQCTGGSLVNGGTTTLTPGAGTATSCTVTNTAPTTITVTKDCVSVPAGFSFGLAVGATTAEVACGGTLGPVAVTPNVAVTVGEPSVPPGMLTSIECGSGPIAGGTTSVTPAPGTNTQCIVHNTANFLASVALTKACVGAVPAGATFGLAVGPTTFSVGCGGSTGPVPVTAGVAVTVGEPTVPANTTATIQCTGGSLVNSSTTSLTLSAGQHVSCTVTNTAIATVSLTKTCQPNQPGVMVELVIGAAVQFVPCGGTLGPVTVTAGTAVMVGEATVPADEIAAIQCTGGVRAPGGTMTITPAPGVTSCTVTNTLNATINVTKACLGVVPAGTMFTLVVGATTLAVPCNGLLGPVSVPANVPVTVGEPQVPAWFSATIQCESGVVVQGGTTTVTPAPGAAITCGVTNTAASLTITKVCVPATLTTVFAIAVGGETRMVPCGGAFGPITLVGSEPGVTLGVGEHSVPAGFAATIQCNSGPVIAGGFTGVTPMAGVIVTCTLTNTQTTTVTVTKVCAATPPPSITFGLSVGATSQNVPCGGTLGSLNVTPNAPITVGEAAVPPGFSATIQCSGGSGMPGGTTTLTPAAGTATSCTVTNTQATAVTVNKVCVGVTSGMFGLAVGATAMTVGCGGTLGPVSVTPGVAVTVGEPTVPSGMAAQITCVGGVNAYNANGGAVSITPPANSVTTCTVINAAAPLMVPTVQVGADCGPQVPQNTVLTLAIGNLTFALPCGVGTGNVPVAAGVTITVGETPVPAGLTATITCVGGVSASNQNGGTLMITPPANTGTVCIILNRVAQPSG
jgi:hypothetical protein